MGASPARGPRGAALARSVAIAVAVAACGTDVAQGPEGARCVGDGWECIADPVLRFSAGAIDGNLGDPVVIHEGGQYAMYYGAVLADFASETVRIFRATSSDGLVWNRPAVPLIEPGASGEWDAAAVETPSIVKGPDGQYRLYYSGTYTTEAEDKYQIGLATSTDGTTFTKHAANPVIPLGAAGEFDDYSILDSSILYDAAAGEYKLWYSALSSKLQASIGMATSSDGVAWRKQGQVLAMTLERKKASDFGIMGTTVVFDGAHYRMAYSVLMDIIPDHPTSSGLWYATSSDGKTWQKDPSPIISVAPQTESSESQEITSPTLLLDQDAMRIWFMVTRTNYTSTYDSGVFTALQGSP